MPHEPGLPQHIGESASPSFANKAPTVERRQANRVDDQRKFHVAETAIAITKHEDPEGHEGFKQDFRVMQKITRSRVKQGTMTEDQRDEFLADYHAAYSSSDSYDAKTGAYNDPSIKRAVRKTIENTPETGKEHVLVALDLDNLGRMNRESSRGHDSADEAIKGFVHFHIAELYERFGYQARMGRLARAGDEFVIVIPNTSLDEVGKFFEEIEGKRSEAMKPIVEKEGLPTDITAMRELVALKPDDTFASAYERADVELMRRKVEKRSLQDQAASQTANNG